MSIVDQMQILNSIHPFDELSSSVKEDLISKMNIAYYPKNTILISPTVPADFLYIIIKGVVHENIEDELQNVYGANDTFDPTSLIEAKTASHFVVKEELICYEMCKDKFLDLLQDYDEFKTFYLENFVSRHQRLKERDNQSELTSFMVAKIEEIFLHTPCIVDQSISIKSALLKMKELNSDSIIVQCSTSKGIVTNTGIRDQVLLGSYTLEDEIGKIATYGLITIDKSDFLFNALILFTKYSIKRVAVVENSEVVGMLEQIDLLSFFANHTHLIAIKIDRATSIECLKNLEQDMRTLVNILHTKGVKVRYISKLSTELNIKIYKKVFELCVPKELHTECALIVMGSEGRGEQLLRSDQDNALILKDKTHESEFEKYMKIFNSNLSEIGFPQCKGNVMVTNYYWRRDLEAFKYLIDEWCDTFNNESLQALSIFLDSMFVAGDERLLSELREYLFKRFTSRDDLLSHLAKASLHFETPLSILSNFIVDKTMHENELDLKKGGIFAIVHGIRTLSLERKILQTNTIERIKELNNLGLFDKAFASELMEAYDTLLSVRLKAMIAHDINDIENLNYINPLKLEKNQRDLLKDSFKVVNKFKKFLTYHYHLNIVL
ncbi:MAG: CBS domain-containing protein [Helicobacteraceae bacterium]|nr:CBS domain-containing protein [Helicobacteraceae bacterium]